MNRQILILGLMHYKKQFKNRPDIVSDVAWRTVCKAIRDTKTDDIAESMFRIFVGAVMASVNHDIL